MAEDANSHLPAMYGIPVSTNANHRVCMYSLHKSRQLLARRHYGKVYVKWRQAGVRTGQHQLFLPLTAGQAPGPRLWLSVMATAQAIGLLFPLLQEAGAQLDLDTCTGSQGHRVRGEAGSKPRFASLQTLVSFPLCGLRTPCPQLHSIFARLA